MLEQIKIYFLLYIIYAIAGWIMEVICSLFTLKKLVNRGFLIGPYCPIYGCGAILITLLCDQYKANPILLFGITILLCGTLEYITSYVMEKLFHLRWWDYSNKKVNINGRVCLDTIIPFGILGLIILYITNPFILDKLNILSNYTINIIFYIIFIIYLIDNIISFVTICTIKNTTAIVSKENREDNTEQITKKVREILLEKKKAFTQKRLINAYPKLQTIRIKVKEKIEQTREEIDHKIEQTIGIIDDKIDKTKEELNKKIKTLEKKKKE